MGSPPPLSPETAKPPSGRSARPSWSGRVSPGAIGERHPAERRHLERPARIAEGELIKAAAERRIRNAKHHPALVARRQAGDAAERQAHHRRKPPLRGDAELPGERQRRDVSRNLGMVDLARPPRQDTAASAVRRTSDSRRTAQLSCHHARQGNALRPKRSGSISASARGRDEDAWFAMLPRCNGHFLSPRCSR